MENGSLGLGSWLGLGVGLDSRYEIRLDCLALTTETKYAAKSDIPG